DRNPHTLEDACHDVHILNGWHIANDTASMTHKGGGHQFERCVLGATDNDPPAQWDASLDLDLLHAYTPIPFSSEKPSTPTSNSSWTPKRSCTRFRMRPMRRQMSRAEAPP